MPLVDEQGKYVDPGRRPDKVRSRNASGAALWIPGLAAVLVAVLGLLFVQNIFLGLMLVVLASIGGSFVAAGCVVSAVRDRTGRR